MRRLAAIAAAVAGSIIALILIFRWPFTEQRVILSLARSTRCDVRISGFHPHFFPTPGCDLDRAVFTRTADGPPIGTADRIELRTSWANLITLRKRLSLLRAENLHVSITTPAPPERDHGGNGPQNTIAELVADGATLDVNGIHFAFPQLRLTEVSAKTAIGYTMEVDSPHPPGRIRATGSVGPFAPHVANTPAHGHIEIAAADLGRYPVLDGTLEATGDFRGTLADLSTKGQLDISGFEVNHNQHPTDLKATWDANLNVTTGALRLNAIETDFLRTHLSATGTVENKTVALDFTSRKARLEDLASLTTQSGESALHGPMTLQARIELPTAEPSPFLHRLRVNGSFRVDNGTFRKAATQTKIDDLSARARREKEETEEGRTAERVTADLAGTVQAANGLTRLSRLSFKVPGATAAGAGTYNLETKRINIEGKVTMLADVSEATSGFKSVVLKPFNALFRHHRKHGATLPVAITGTYPHPQFKVGLH